MTSTLDSTTNLDPSGPRTVRAHWIDDWRPEDPTFWAAGGAQVARRNLVFSVLSEHIGFSVWTMWSVLVLFLGPAYGFAPEEKFLLTIVPALVGSCCACRTPSRSPASAVATGPCSAPCC